MYWLQDAHAIQAVVAGGLKYLIEKDHLYPGDPAFFKLFCIPVQPVFIYIYPVCLSVYVE